MAFTAQLPAVADLHQAMEKAIRIADRAAIEDIESYGLRIDCFRPARVYDVSPMLDPREQPPESLDMATEAIEYARLRGLVVEHMGERHHLRIVRSA